MIIQTDNLTKRFGRHGAVRGVSLSVPQGATVALIGANGAGKTTTLKMLMNILRADSGSATVLGVDSRELSAEQYARIGYVSENQKLRGGLSIGQFFDGIRPLYPTWDRALETSLRQQYRLPAGRKLGKLSHGMRMKACLAAALAYRPELLVLDEPLSGLDPLVRDEIVEGLVGNAEATSILISSHELAEIEGLATHVAFINRGELIFQQSIEDLAGRFRDVTAAFADAAPNTAARLDDAWLSPTWNGRTLRFACAAYVGDEPLKQALTARFGELSHFSAAPMSLRDTSKALMRAYRKDAE